MTAKEVFTKIMESKVYVVCATILLSVTIFSVGSCTSTCIEHMTKADAERAKYRAQQSEAFWKSSTPQK
jgi:hypothetical protein